MLTLLLTLLFMLTVVTAMAVGVLFGRKPISGTCGGIAALGLDTECEICGGDPAKCDVETSSGQPGTAEFYDASQVDRPTER